jgi:uncharacterized protein
MPEKSLDYADVVKRCFLQANHSKGIPMKLSNLLRIAAAVLCVTFAASTTYAQDSNAEKMAAAKELLVASNADKQFEIILPIIFNQLRQNMPPALKEVEAREKIFDKILAKALERRQEVIDQIAGIYVELLTVDEMKAIAAFYKTPVGQKLITVMPQLAQKSMEVGNAWGMKIAQEAMQKVNEEAQKSPK